VYQRLKQDIELHGQREPVVFYREQLLDGRNRERACRELGIPLSDCELDDNDDPVAYVISANLHRRHLNESQRALVAARLQAMLKPAAKERQKAGGGDQKSPAAKSRRKSVVVNLPQPNGEQERTRDQAAAMLNVSGKTVDHATTVLQHGSQELIQAVQNGEVSVSRAASVAKATPKKDQAAAAIGKTQRASKTPFEQLQHWWSKADTAAKNKFRSWIDKDI
jgi:hypothetical protein